MVYLVVRILDGWCSYAGVRIEEELRPVGGLDWITALHSPAIQALVEDEALQLSLFDEQDLFEFTSDDYPDERLVACRNPLPARKRALKREELLLATERELEITDDGFTYARNQDEFPEKGERTLVFSNGPYSHTLPSAESTRTGHSRPSGPQTRV